MTLPVTTLGRPPTWARSFLALVRKVRWTSHRVDMMAVTTGRTASGVPQVTARWAGVRGSGRTLDAAVSQLLKRLAARLAAEARGDLREMACMTRRYNEEMAARAVAVAALEAAQRAILERKIPKKAAPRKARKGTNR